MSPAGAPRAIALLAARLRAAPALVGAAARQPLGRLPFLPAAARTIVTTGLGSSAAHARLLAHLLAAAGLPARFAATGALAADPRDALVVFSQGLSPNARIALQRPDAWLGALLVSAAPRRPADAGRRAVLRALRAAGGRHVVLPGGAERGLLLRVAGPLAGYVIAQRLAAAIIAAAGGDATPLALDTRRLAGALRAAAATARRLPADLLDGEVALLAGGDHAELADNLSLTVAEGLWVAPPPVWELLDFAHGPFQQLYPRPATLLVLDRGAGGDAALLAGIGRMLDARRHRLVRLPASLPGTQALLEHQMAIDTLVLRAIAARRLDPARWPGRGRDAPLYRLARLPDAAPPPPASPPSALAALTWPELAAALRAGRHTAVVPLGATEQHGPHLPYATDTWIAAALAARFCARVPEAVALPPLPFGCSAEHAAFPGTLTLRWTTLRAVLEDLLANLGRHGFRRVLLFSAHGGNDALLSAERAPLSAAAAPARLTIVSGLADLTAAWRRASAAHGVPAAAAGLHAGEFETSILLGLRPAAVRRTALTAGRRRIPADPHALFYPDLRRAAPRGVVGDPRGAAAPRAAAYLDAWTDLLVDRYRRTKKRT